MIDVWDAIYFLLGMVFTAILMVVTDKLYDND